MNSDTSKLEQETQLLPDFVKIIKTNRGFYNKLIALFVRLRQAQAFNEPSQQYRE